MHEDTMAKLSAYLDAELSAEEREALESELEKSGTLRHELEKLKHVRDWAREFPGRLPESDVWESIEDKLTAPIPQVAPKGKSRPLLVRFLDTFAFDPFQWSTGAKRTAVVGLAGFALAGMSRSLYLEQRTGYLEEKTLLHDEQMLQLVAEGDWRQTAVALRGRDGATFEVRCPQDGQARGVWGSGVYTDDSSICTAAVHSGLITFGFGGLVAIQIARGLDEYTGSVQNGIETRDFGEWDGSFEFVNEVDVAITATAAEWIGWAENAVELRRWIGTRSTYRCPANGKIGSVWGSTPYTDDSSICTAAVHAGLINAQDGGVVTIEATGEQQRYRGTTRNGVDSRSFRSWPGSFVFATEEDGALLAEPAFDWIDWRANASDMRGWDGFQATFACPADGQARTVWGSGIYTDDSSICNAAVHQGLITFAEGGVVTIEILPGQSEYLSETRNGLVTRLFGSYSGSFRFVN